MRRVSIAIALGVSLIAGAYGQKAKQPQKIVVAWLPFQIVGDDGNRYGELEAEKVLSDMLRQATQSNLEVIESSRVLKVWMDDMGMPKPLMTGDERDDPLDFREEKLRELCKKLGATQLITGTIQFHRRRDMISRSTTDLFSRCTAFVFSPTERTYLFNWDLEMADVAGRKDHKNWFGVPKDEPQREWKVFRFLAEYPERPKDVKLMYQKATGVVLCAALHRWYTQTFPDKD